MAKARAKNVDLRKEPFIKQFVCLIMGTGKKENDPAVIGSFLLIGSRPYVQLSWFIHAFTGIRKMTCNFLSNVKMFNIMVRFNNEVLIIPISQNNWIEKRMEFRGIISNQTEYS